MPADDLRAKVVGAELHHAGAGAVGGGQDRAEIQVVRQDDVIAGGGVGHDIDIQGVGAADGRPVLGRYPRRGEITHPERRQIHVDQ